MYPILHTQHFEPHRSSDKDGGGMRKKMRSDDQLTDVNQSSTQCQSSSNDAKSSSNDAKSSSNDAKSSSNDAKSSSNDARNTCDGRNVNRVNRPIRILERRYLLTKTGYKFIDVSIVAVLPAYVNIIKEDCHGKEISMSLDVWKEFVNRKQAILAHLFGEVDEETQARDLPPILIGNLKIRFGKITVSILRVEAPETRLAISAKTVRYMFELEHCISCLIAARRTLTDNVDTKLTRFLAIASCVDPTNASKAIRDSEYFDCNNIVDCELVALCFRTAT